MDIIHNAIRGMKIGEVAEVSFELDPERLDESFKLAVHSNKIYLDLKFELNLVRKGKF